MLVGVEKTEIIMPALLVHGFGRERPIVIVAGNMQRLSNVEKVRQAWQSRNRGFASLISGYRLETGITRVSES